MSVSFLNSVLPSSPQQQGFYARAVHLAKQYVNPGTLDWIEWLAAPAIPAVCQIFSEGFSCFTRLPTFKEWIVFGVSLGFSLLHMKCVKFPFIKQEIRSIIESSKENDRTMLIFSSSSTDWNGAFKTHSQLDGYQKLGRNYSIEILESSSKRDRHEKLDSLADQKKKYNRIDFKLHGNKECLRLGPEDEIYLNALGFFEWLRDSIKPGGTIVLEVCEAGKGLENIARRISQYCPEAIILASSADIHIFTGCEYDPQGIPSFNDSRYCKGKDTTRIYRNGSLVEG